jgi:hypothetical protein
MADAVDLHVAHDGARATPYREMPPGLSRREAHERALNSSPNAILALLARTLSRRTGPVVKLH